MEVHIDIETFSVLEPSDVGAHVYAEHPSTRVLLLSWAVGSGPVRTYRAGDGLALPDEFLELVAARDTVFVAHNAAFERTVLRRFLPGNWLEPCRWRCTMVHALALGLPASLDELGELLGLGGKTPGGTKLLRRFSTPALGGPWVQSEALWAEFITYNRRDVELEQLISARLSAYPLRDDDWAEWSMDQDINDRGVPIDVDFCKAAADVAEQNIAALVDTVRSMGIVNPGSTQQVHAWLQERGLHLDNLRAATIEDQLDDPETPAEIRTVLAARIELAGASVKKYQTAVASTSADGRARGLLQYWGARRTGRWAGRRIQIQNLPRGSIEDPTELVQARSVVRAGYAACSMLYPQVSDLLRSLVRTAICAPAGRTLVSADLASIESVMLAWASSCGPLLRVFSEGRDPYIDFATRLFNVPYERVVKSQRKLAKPAVLGCGYGMGAAGLQAYAQGMGIQLTMDEAQRHVSVFRTAYREIVDFWANIEAVAYAAVQNPGVDYVVKTPGEPFRFRRMGSFLFLFLPSGRRLAYYRPAIEMGQYGPELTYNTGDGPRMRVGTRGPKLVENVVQAISRDVLVEGLTRAVGNGVDVIAHVHDEIVAEANEGDGQAVLDMLLWCMAKAPSWAPHAPIRAAGWHGPVYRKD